MAWRETNLKCIVISSFSVVVVSSRMRLVHLSPWSGIDVSCGVTVDYIIYTLPKRECECISLKNQNTA
jgi:hypothetical protein